MKKIILFSVILFLHNSAFSQDSLKIAYSEVSDTLVRQHFIDRYENFFMTKVPSRSMVKVGYVSSYLRGSGLDLAYEYKVAPAFSLEGGVFLQREMSDDALSFSFFNNPGHLENLWITAKIRWYNNMQQRIAKGLNANNFSGSYFSLSGEQSIIVHNRFPHYGTSVRRLGLQFGFQSRLFNRGYSDFSIGVFHRPLDSDVDRNYYKKGFDTKNLLIATQATLGLAFGDWKRKSSIPKCDILLCDEFVKKQWKVFFPDINIGFNKQWMEGEIGFERKISKSAFSVGINLKGSYAATSIYGNKYESSLANGTIQARYYFLQRSQILKGKGGNNLSGFYAGLQTRHWYMTYNHVNYYFGKPASTFNQAGVVTGYQQRLFGKIFVDASIEYLRTFQKPNQYILAEPNDLNLKVGVGWLL